MSSEAPRPPLPPLVISLSGETPVFLRNCWYVAAWDHELIDGRMLARTLLEGHVLLYRGESGQIASPR
jgi:phenylpropionate dioxygenase-like ring-hydroxylating dioxygenase large terminal subunit